jgi:hypothetical protein
MKPDDRPPVEVSGTIDRETTKAVLLVADGKKKWIPKLVIVRQHGSNAECTLEVMHWFADKEGLI